MSCKTSSIIISFIVITIPGNFTQGRCPSADLTGDCFIDFDDFALMAAQWPATDFDDVAEMANQWLNIFDPHIRDDVVLIPAGEFRMGDHFDEGDLDNFPPHDVLIDQFYMGICEVTNREYCEFLNSALSQGQIHVDDGVVYGFPNGDQYCNTYPESSYPSQIDWNGREFTVLANKADHPMVMVTWYGAAAYAQFYDKRLPTEAHWEKAARGGLVGKAYPWGDSITHNDANYVGTGGKDIWNITAPVGSFAPNGYGLYDVAGNALEWCADKYDKGYYVRSPRSNPTGPEVTITFRNNDFTKVDLSEYRVTRGALWKTAPEGLNVGGRGYGKAGDIYYVPGFRCAVQD